MDHDPIEGETFLDYIKATTLRRFQVEAAEDNPRRKVQDVLAIRKAVVAHREEQERQEHWDAMTPDQRLDHIAERHEGALQEKLREIAEGRCPVGIPLKRMEIATPDL